MTGTGTKFVVAATAIAIAALAVAVASAALALTAMRDQRRAEKRTTTVERRLHELCRREVVTGGQIVATGLRLTTTSGC